MSIDVEGFDLDVLRSNDWRQFKPKVILAEDYGSESIEKSLASSVAYFLGTNDYVMFAKTVNTLFFRRVQ